MHLSNRNEFVLKLSSDTYSIFNIYPIHLVLDCLQLFSYCHHSMDLVSLFHDKVLSATFDFVY